jgi:hypothetical protein
MHQGISTTKSDVLAPPEVSDDQHQNWAHKQWRKSLKLVNNMSEFTSHQEVTHTLMRNTTTRID